MGLVLNRLLQLHTELLQSAEHCYIQITLIIAILVVWHLDHFYVENVALDLGTTTH